MSTLLVLAACGAPEARREVGPGNNSTAAEQPDSPEPQVALVVTGSGLAGVPVATSTPAWTVDGAVAAPDGSAVFGLGAPSAIGGASRDVMSIDPLTGALTKVGEVLAAATTRISAVEPGGERIVLVTLSDDSTVVRTYDTSFGSLQATRTFEGILEPEAFSLDRNRLFAARVYRDFYNVHVLDLATGQQYPTLGPDKTKPPENMYGTVVQAALSDDRTQLATLYRDTTKPGRTAFVHLLFLESGATFCIDLHAPFAAGGPGADAIEWRGGLIAVGHRPSTGGEPTIANIDPQAVLASPPQQHYPADARAESRAPSIPAGVAATPGFERFVALVPGNATPA